MKIDTVGEYIEQGYTGSQSYIDNDTYRRILDTIVVVCVDVLLLYEGKVVLGRRDQYPQKDWWLFGGRMRTGEMFNKSAQRLIKHELDISVNEERFSMLTTFAAAWNQRAHPPIDNGTHTVSVVLVCNIKDAEYESIRINEEYSKIKLFDLEDIKNNDTFHPALRQCVNAVVNNTTSKVL